jgi:hypothetical protein
MIVPWIFLLIVVARTVQAATLRGRPVRFAETVENARRSLDAATESFEDGLWLIPARTHPGVRVVATGLYAVRGPRPRDTPSIEFSAEFKFEPGTAGDVVVRLFSPTTTFARWPGAEPLAPDVFVMKDASADRVAELATDPAVVWIERLPRLKRFDVESSRVLFGSSPLPEEFEPTDEVVTVSDTGLDTDHCAFHDPTKTVPKATLFAFGSMPSLADSGHRKVRGYFNSFGLGDFQFGSRAHGTATAGVAVGAQCDDWTDFGLRDAFRGVAPAARVLFYDVSPNDNDIYIPIDLVRVFEFARTAANSRIHSASWGSVYCDGVYDDLALQLDRSAHADPFLIHVVAAGNCGPTGRVSSPATAKSVISVGASLSRAAAFAGYSSAQRAAHPEYFSFESVSHFSSIGPLADGRSAPSLVAPGVAVVVAHALPGAGPGHDTFTVMSGTSFAAPAVAGAVVRVVGAHRARFGGERPRSSRVRAFFDLATRPALRRVRTTSTSVTFLDFSPPPRGAPLLSSFESTTFLSAGPARAAWCGSVDSDVVAHWTDVPGFPGTDRALINDFDLVALDPSGAVRLGADARNPFERVSLRGPHVRVVLEPVAPIEGAQVVDLALRGSVQSCGTCLPFDPPSACVVAHGVGLARCEWNGTLTCVPTQCDADHVLAETACVPAPANATVCDDGFVVNGTCALSRCDVAGYAGPACTCLGSKICAGVVVPCAATPCVLESVTSPPLPSAAAPPFRPSTLIAVATVVVLITT